MEQLVCLECSCMSWQFGCVSSSKIIFWGSVVIDVHGLSKY